MGCVGTVLQLLLAAATLVVLLTAAISPAGSQALPGCPSKCGQVEVPYPFGLTEDGDKCYKEGFSLTCNNTHYNPPRLFRGTYEILEINLLQGQMRATISIARDCYDAAKNPLNTGVMSASLQESPFTFSREHDRFFVVGCDSLAYMNDPDGQYATGCVSYCRNLSSIENNTCSGIGCCQTEIPRASKYFQAEFQSFNNHSYVHGFNPCSYAFVADKDSFVFNTSFLAADYTYTRVSLPVVLEFSMENHTCNSAREDTSSYACRSANSECFDSKNGLGYICNCSQGYHGNPYLEDGCIDIDECKEPNKYTCHGLCTNTPGNYNCTCQPGFHSKDPKMESCNEDSHTIRVNQGLPLPIMWTIGSISIAVFFLLIIFGTCWGYKKMEMIHLRQKFFEQNGGVFLKRQIASNRATAFNIFTLAELEKATDRFSNDSLLGVGGNGSVHKGTLKDERCVAIKKAKEDEGAPTKETEKVTESKRKEFASEMLILAGLNHKNVVKLLGCCLEVKIPMLVYEFITNNTLSCYIHEKKSPIPFSECLRIATEAAKALTYLHDEVEPPIVHGDIKPSNILLDDNYSVKVADFGTSIFADKNDNGETGTICVKGTPGYLDPEYMQTGQPTDKSDVYSFGIVLMELLTRRKAAGTLKTDFIHCMKRNTLKEILHPCYLDEQGKQTEQLVEISELAVKCVGETGNVRPEMAEVVRALETIRRTMTPSKPSERLKVVIPSVRRVEPFDGPSTSTKFYPLEIDTAPMLDARYYGR